MTDSTVNQPFAEFWQTDLLDLFFPSTQAADPLLTQDADLLRQFSFIPGLKEILMVRQVHALEHATVWVLSNTAKSVQAGSTTPLPVDNNSLSGMSTEQGFYLYGEVNAEDLKRAVQVALGRITSGEWDLAVHPRCGTNLSVGMLVTAGLALGASALLPRDPIGQIVGLGLAAATATQITPDLGKLAQRYITTAIPFNLAINRISSVRDSVGRPAHFVQVNWVE
ncbi:MAG: DUF6391 domain-containing protein [Kovacikia sp.]